MDWHLLAFIGTLCILIFILFLFVTRDNTSEMASTTKSRIRIMHETSQPSANLTDYSSIQSLNMPGLGNLAPLGFEAISMLVQSECMETLNSMNAGPHEEPDRRFHLVTRGQVPFTSAGDFYMPNETSPIPQNDSVFNSETGEDYYSEQLPPSYEEAMGYRSSTRNRRRRV